MGGRFEIMEYRNPVNRGFFPDPAIVKHGDEFYLINSSFQYFPAIPISKSVDLVNWEIVGHAIDKTEYLDLSDTLDSRGIWACDICKADGGYYILATLRHNYTPEDKKPMRSILSMFAKHPAGPYSKPVKLPIDNIDPSLFIDDDGSKYCVTAPGATVYRLNDDCTKVIGEGVFTALLIKQRHETVIQQ